MLGEMIIAYNYRAAEVQRTFYLDGNVKLLEPSDARLGQNRKTAYWIDSFSAPDVPESGVPNYCPYPPMSQQVDPSSPPSSVNNPSVNTPCNELPVIHFILCRQF